MGECSVRPSAQGRCQVPSWAKPPLSMVQLVRAIFTALKGAPSARLAIRPGYVRARCGGTRGEAVNERG
jgi:hypothetical protein